MDLIKYYLDLKYENTLEKIMALQNYIIILQEAYYAFMLPPDINKRNAFGICHYLDDKLDEYEIIAILDEQYHDKYMFGGGFTQRDLYRKEMKGKYFERADWIKKRIKDFKLLIETLEEEDD